MSPRNPSDPNDLRLRPSKSDGRGEKADFSNVQSQSDTVRDGSVGGGEAGRGVDFSNVKSHADTVPALGGSGGGGGSMYTVRKGDTLSAIAQSQYGKASHWRAIFDANRDQIDNPDLIQPGQVLKVPTLED